MDFGDDDSDEEEDEGGYEGAIVLNHNQEFIWKVNMSQCLIILLYILLL